MISLTVPSTFDNNPTLDFLSKKKRAIVEQHIISNAGKDWHMTTTDMRSYFGETLYDRRDLFIDVTDPHYEIGRKSMTRRWKSDITASVLDSYGCSFTAMTTDFYDRDTAVSLTSFINTDAVNSYLSTVSHKDFTVQDYEYLYGIPVSYAQLQHRILYSKLLIYERNIFPINYYTETLNQYGNRLHDHVPDSPLSIIRTPHELRSIAYSDMGLADYDIEACFPSLLQNILLSKKGNCPYDAINMYIEQKDDVRFNLANELGISARCAKQIINAVFFGATAQNRPPSKRKNLRHVLNGDADKIALLHANRFIKAFRADLKKATIDLINLHSDGEMITSALGTSAPLFYRTKHGNNHHVQYSRLLFFILSSYETAIMQSIVSTYGSQIKALVYDGFIADDQISAQELSDHVHDHFGFNIRFSKEHLIFSLGRNAEAGVSMSTIPTSMRIEEGIHIVSSPYIKS